MVKEQFIKLMAKRGNLKRYEAEKYVNLFLDTLKYAIKEYGGVKFVGFGKFFIKEHKEKMARNLKTGEPGKVEKHNTVKFTVSDVFRDSLNK